MNESIKVVKIGGNVVDNPHALRKFISDFAHIPGKKVLVHGGGKEATRMSASMGIETTMINGRRVTDRQTLDVVTMVYAGLVNKRIVSMLQAEGCNALGLTGADGDAVKAARRSPRPVDYGYVGDIDPTDVNAEFIASLCERGITPVFCAIMHDGAGTLLNCNADSVASAVALGTARLADVDLTYCFEKRGVLRDINDPTSVIPEITSVSYPALRAEGVVADGMIPKIENALDAVGRGVRSVRICHSDDVATGGGTIVQRTDANV